MAEPAAPGAAPAPALVVLAGLPGTGKSRVAAELAHRLDAVLLSVDPIEAALRRAGIAPDQPVGLAAYVVADAVAEAELGRGRVVVADAVNAVEEARAGWRGVAARTGATVRFVEVVCSDLAAHRTRLEGRGRRFAEIAEPTWAEVQRLASAWAPWADERRVVDTVGDLDAQLAAVCADLGAAAHTTPSRRATRVGR